LILSVCLFVCLFVCLSVCLSGCSEVKKFSRISSISQSTANNSWLRIWPIILVSIDSVCLSVCLFVCLFVCLSVYLSACLVVWRSKSFQEFLQSVKVPRTVHGFWFGKSFWWVLILFVWWVLVVIVCPSVCFILVPSGFTSNLPNLT
jgi:hypothetical protein